LPDDYFSTYASKVRALTTSDLTTAGKSFLNPDRLVWVVVGDLTKVEVGIRELNLGAVHVVDADGNAVR
jgi:zinc protease